MPGLGVKHPAMCVHLGGLGILWNYILRTLNFCPAFPGIWISANIHVTVYMLQLLSKTNKKTVYSELHNFDISKFEDFFP